MSAHVSERMQKYNCDEGDSKRGTREYLMYIQSMDSMTISSGTSSTPSKVCFLILSIRGLVSIGGSSSKVLYHKIKRP